MSEEQKTTALVVAESIQVGAALPDDQWPVERIAATLNTLPKEMDALPVKIRVASLIHFYKVAATYDLSIEAKEIHGWWDAREGRFVTMVGRDGIVKMIMREPDILGVTSNVVRDGDTFTSRTEGDRVVVTHESSPFGDGNNAVIVGAYAVVRRREGPDKIVVRYAADFAHLSKKHNWQKNGPEMLETRCIATAGRMVSARLANVYTEGEVYRADDGSMVVDEAVRYDTADADPPAVDDIPEAEFEDVTDDQSSTGYWIVEGVPPGAGIWCQDGPEDGTHEFVAYADADVTEPVDTSVDSIGSYTTLAGAQAALQPTDPEPSDE